MKRLFICFAILILVLSSISLAIDEPANIQTSYDWLRKQEATTVYDMSLAALALNNVDSASAQPIISWVSQQQDIEKGCFPSGACTVKDTSLAIILLSQEGYDTDDAKQWLLEQQQTNTVGGMYLQIITEKTGVCSIEYKPENSETWKSKEISVEKGKLSSQVCPTKTTFFNLGNCIESNLFGINPSLPIKVLCRDLGNAKISISYVDQNAYYLVYSSLSNTIEDLTLNMGYFGNYEDTLYANWALSVIGENINSISWLKKNFSPNNVRDNALIYIVSNQEPYIHNLLTLRNTNTGSFNSIFETGLACYALTQYGTYGEEVEQARTWLDSRQQQDGSWNSNIADTAIALYGCYSTEAVNLPPCEGDDCYPGIETPGTQPNTEPEPTTCSTDADCNFGEVCDPYTNQCIEEQDVCNYDGFCDTDFGENENNCPTDCETSEPTQSDEPQEEVCGDGFCGFGENQSNCPEDCKEEEESSGFFWWFIIIILLLALALGAAYYFFIMKPGKSLSDFFKRKRKPKEKIKMPSYPRKQQQKQKQQKPKSFYRPMQTKKKSAVEEELEKSLQEAKKLLKK